jgi:ribosomal protein L32
MKIQVSKNQYRKAWRMRGDPSVKVCPTCGLNVSRKHRLHYVCLFCGYVKMKPRKGGLA